MDACIYFALKMWYSYRPCHKKTCLCHMRTAKTQISLRIRAVWLASLLFAARLYNASSFYIWNFKTLTSLCSWAGLFESYLVATPEDKFSRDVAQYRWLSLSDVMVLKDLLEHVETASRRRSALSLSVFSVQEEPLKDKLSRLLCSWECPSWFKQIQKGIGFIILDPFVDLFITLCILGNTAFMALDRHGQTDEQKQTLEDGNQVSIFSCTTAMLLCDLRCMAIPCVYILAFENSNQIFVQFGATAVLSLSSVNFLCNI